MSMGISQGERIKNKYPQEYSELGFILGSEYS